MSGLGTRLPPLNLLRAFDAAGRHLSFKNAAEELNVTSSTISHQIRSLEDYLGLELFHRGVREVKLTADGAAFLEYVSRGFTYLRNGNQHLVDRMSNPQLRISANPFMAAEVLIPLIPAFRTAFPGIRVAIEATESLSGLLENDVHYGLRFGNGKWPGLDAVKLFQSSAVVVCSPGLCGPAKPDVKTLHKMPKVDYAYRKNSAWESWFALSGQKPKLDEKSETVTVENFHSAMQAVRRGLGASVGLLPVIQPWLSTGELMEIEGSRYELDEALYFVWSSERDPEEDHPGASQWLLEHLNAVFG